MLKANLPCALPVREIRIVPAYGEHQAGRCTIELGVLPLNTISPGITPSVVVSAPLEAKIVQILIEALAPHVTLWATREQENQEAQP